MVRSIQLKRMPDFTREYQFEHITSSPHYPQSNGEAERAVQTVKHLLKKGDPYLALLSYRATPLQSGFSPSELLMSRKLRTNVPVTREVLKPQDPDLSSVRERDERHKTRQQSNNSRHGARELTPLNPGESVWIPDREQEATVTQEAGTRSYVQTSDGTYRRNRRALVHLPDSIDGQSDDTNPNLGANASEPSVRRSSRVTHPPERLDPSWNIGHS